jgi:hypothetical protein
MFLHKRFINKTMLIFIWCWSKLFILLMFEGIRQPTNQMNRKMPNSSLAPARASEATHQARPSVLHVLPRLSNHSTVCWISLRHLSSLASSLSCSYWKALHCHITQCRGVLNLVLFKFGFFLINAQFFMSL